MMSPERQKVSPVLPRRRDHLRVVSHRRRWTQEDKLMSMRGNNLHFSRATVHHELIPGHHLQGFMTDALQPAPPRVRHAVLERGLGALLGDAAVGPGLPARRPRTASACCSGACTAPRGSSSRCSFHLGSMTPQECIDFLVDRVGHERANADRRGAPLVQRRLLARSTRWPT